MDVYVGNIIYNEFGLRLIDWEYVGDGDIVLELVVVWIMSGECCWLVEVYVWWVVIDVQLFWWQVVFWCLWVLLLMVGWYEMCWWQSGDW